MDPAVHGMLVEPAFDRGDAYSCRCGHRNPRQARRELVGAFVLRRAELLNKPSDYNEGHTYGTVVSSGKEAFEF